MDYLKIASIFVGEFLTEGISKLTCEVVICLEFVLVLVNAVPSSTLNLIPCLKLKRCLRL